MFRLSFMVDDKHLANVLRAVSGFAINMEPPQPVVNAAVTSTKKVTAVSDGDVLSMVATKLPSTFTVHDAIKALGEIGRSTTKQNGYSTIDRMRKKGLCENYSKGVYVLANKGAE